MDAVIVSIGSDVSVSVLVTLYLNEIGVKKVLAKAVNHDHGKVLKKVGATEVIFPERAMAIKLAQSLSRPNVLDFFPLADDYHLLQIAPPRAFIGKSLRDLNLRALYNINVLAIKEIIPDRPVLVPSAHLSIKDSDVLVVLGNQADIRRIKDLRGEEE